MEGTSPTTIAVIIILIALWFLGGHSISEGFVTLFGPTTNLTAHEITDTSQLTVDLSSPPPSVQTQKMSPEILELYRATHRY